MGPVELDHVDARLDRTRGGGREGVDEPVDARLVERLRRGHAGEGDGAGSQKVPLRLPSPPGIGAFGSGVHLGLAPPVAELDARQGAARVDGLDDAREAGDLPAVPQAEVPRRQPPLGADRRRLDDDRPESAGGARRVVLHVPVGGPPVLGVHRVHAHRGQPQAIAGRRVA